MYFLIEDNDLLETYNTIWDKVSTDIKEDIDSKPAYNKNLFKTKIKSHSDEVRGFYYKKIPKANSNHACLAVFSFDSFLDGILFLHFPSLVLKVAYVAA